MEKHAIKITKILDGSISLGNGYIDQASLIMGGQSLPATITLTPRSGVVQWTDQENLGDPGPYNFEFDFFAPAKIQISSNKTQVAADGIEQFILTITCEDTAETTVVLAVYQDDEKIGTTDVTVSNGSGQKMLTIAVAGIYTYQADPDTLDPIWGVAKFLTTEQATVEAI